VRLLLVLVTILTLGFLLGYWYGVDPQPVDWEVVASRILTWATGAFILYLGIVVGRKERS
jgi:hypothetical protein